MPAPDSPTIIVARYLQANGYTKTLTAFLEETNLTPESLEPKPDAENVFTLESILDKKRLFDLSQQLEKTNIDNSKAVTFSTPYPSIPTTLTTPNPANILFISLNSLTVSSTERDRPTFVTTTASRDLHIFSAYPPYNLLHTLTAATDSAILSATSLNHGHLLVSTMTGALHLLHVQSGEIITTVRPHKKFATRVVVSPCGSYLASCAYDNTLAVYQITNTAGEEIPHMDPAPLGLLTLRSAPEALAFVTLPSTGKTVLCMSRRNSTSLYYHEITEGLPLISSQNLAPGDASSWVSFHAMHVAVSPKDPTLLAVATDSLPTMKVLFIRIEGEVEVEVFSGAPQSKWSNAQLGWRADGSGVWVNGDDGIVRGIGADGRRGPELVVCRGGEKVRALWAGLVANDTGGDGKEVLVTGGFDKQLKVWEIPKEQDE